MSENTVALTVGGEVRTIGMEVANELFVFTPVQMQFLLSLQKLKNTAAAAISVGKDETWGKTFLASKKFRHYLACKMQEFSARNSLTIEWWYQFGKWAADGKKEYYQGHCKECNFSPTLTMYEAETYRTDDMELKVPCTICSNILDTEKKTEAFQPSREQIESWKEMGARLIPKIERVHHQFENTEIIFQSEGGNNG